MIQAVTEPSQMNSNTSSGITPKEPLEEDVLLSAIPVCVDLQTREKIESAHVEELSEWLKDNPKQDLPPIRVFRDVDGKNWMSDGFHRRLAYERSGRTTIPATVFPGTKEDALLHALGANSKHGLKRTNADKRKAVLLALEKYPGWKASVVADKCKVSADLVSKIMEERKKCTVPYRTTVNGDPVQDRTKSESAPVNGPSVQSSTKADPASQSPEPSATAKVPPKTEDISRTSGEEAVQSSRQMGQREESSSLSSLCPMERGKIRTREVILALREEVGSWACISGAISSDKALERLWSLLQH